MSSLYILIGIEIAADEGVKRLKVKGHNTSIMKLMTTNKIKDLKPKSQYVNDMYHRIKEITTNDFQRVTYQLISIKDNHLAYSISKDGAGEAYTNL